MISFHGNYSKKIYLPKENGALLKGTPDPHDIPKLAVVLAGGIAVVLAGGLAVVVAGETTGFPNKKLFSFSLLSIPIFF